MALGVPEGARQVSIVLAQAHLLLRVNSNTIFATFGNA